ncbi:MAG: 16S rRNA (cytosine(1402)-N(4))-methyltransferase RsmH [Gammaproteobacteria bacterium]|nr:16S rRNA (cytosine(1402)-N(4))-methyltransferase RsmH [Gammaproteobacteria bacterium]
MHVPVLSEEAIEWLAIQPEGVYVDATYGRGGHSARILASLGPLGRLLALDRDPEAERDARRRFGDDPRFEFVHAPFSQLAQTVDERGLAGQVAGVLMDVGVSSPQLDDAARGFSFLQQGPLDMRMDPGAGESAAEWLARSGEDELADVIYSFGEERYSRRIARAIVARRAEQPFSTTTDLAAVIAAAVPRHEPRIHPATRTFQALRIFLNDELGELRAALTASLDVLAPGGRLVVLSFHSLEDRLVKRFMRNVSRSEPKRLRIVERLVRPGRQETSSNPRARSARLRVAERPA